MGGPDRHARVPALAIRLTKATTEGDIEWKTASEPAGVAAAPNDYISFYLEGEYKGQTIALFERRHKKMDGENDVHYWTGDDVIALMGPIPRKELIWEHRENSSSLSNLIRIAGEPASGIDDILDDLLK